MKSGMLAAHGAATSLPLTQPGARTCAGRQQRPNSNTRLHSRHSWHNSCRCLTGRGAEDVCSRHANGRQSMRTSVADRPQVTATDSAFLRWLESQDAPIEKVSISSQHRAGQEIDRTVAAVPLSPGDVALRMPERLIVTLSSVFEDDTVAVRAPAHCLPGAAPQEIHMSRNPSMTALTCSPQELLTCNKLSELACLTLYMMYEKLRGKESRWCAAIPG